MKQKNQLYPVLICLSHVAELRFIKSTADDVTIGPSSTMSDIHDYFQGLSKETKGK